jgi:hypothetical protein
MESYLTYLGAAGSAASMLATFYFWLVRMRREKPCLKPFLLDKEFFLGLGNAEVRQMGLKIGVIVANYSVLPNAVIDARLSMRLRDGWHDVERLAFDKTTAQPFNIAPLQTVLLRMNGVLSFPCNDALEEGNKTAANYLTAFVAQPLTLRLELRHLDQRADSYLLTMPAEESNAVTGTRPIARAA